MIKVHEADNLPVPDDAVRPDAFPETWFFLDAHRDLGTERQIGAMGGASYIPWSKAIAYAERLGIDAPDEQDRFWRMMRALDEEYLGWLAEKTKKPDKPDAQQP